MSAATSDGSASMGAVGQVLGAPFNSRFGARPVRPRASFNSGFGGAGPAAGGDYKWRSVSGVFILARMSRGGQLTCARPGCGRPANAGARARDSSAAHMPVCSPTCSAGLIGAAPVCARPGCGQTASIGARVEGSSVAHVPVCSERCGYELIGPKRGATDDDADERAAAHQQLLVRRQHDKKRFGDLVKMSDIMAKLGRLRARLPEMTELEVATATLAIGRRLAEDGSDIERRIDAALADAHVVVDHILKDEPYDMQTIAARMDALRRDIAADVALDAFDATDVGRAAKAAGVPDDARQLAAYKANPIQKLATFVMAVYDDGYFKFYEVPGKDIISAAGLFYRKGGALIDPGSVVGGKLSEQTDDLRHFADFRAYLDMDPVDGWTVDLANSDKTRTKVWGKRRDETDAVIAVYLDLDEVFVARGRHAAVFKLSPDRTVVTYTPVGGQPGQIATAARSSGGSWWLGQHRHLHYRVTIDMGGNVWLVDGVGMHVLSATGYHIGSVLDSRIFAVTSSADGTVWALVADRNAVDQSSCVQFGLVPDAEYSRGL